MSSGQARDLAESNSQLGVQPSARPMKLFFIHEVDWLRKVVFEVHDFPELMSIRRHRVFVLDFPESGGSSWRAVVRSQQSRAWSGSRVQLISSPVFLGPTLGRWLSTIWALPSVINIVRRLKPDVIVSYAVPTFGWQALIAARLLKIPLLYRAIDASSELRPGLHRRLVRCAEVAMCRFSDRISTHNAALRQRCIGSGANPEKVEILIPGVDLAHMCPGPPDEVLAQSIGIKAGDKILLFMGTLFGFAQLDHLIYQLLSVLRADPKLKLLIIGDGEAAHELKELIERESISGQVIMVGQIEYEHLPRYLRLGTVGLLPFAPAVISHNALPNKVLQYLACGLPSVSIRLDGLTSIVPDDAGVIYVENLSQLSLRAVSLIYDSDELTRQRNHAITFSRGNLNWVEKITEFENMLISMLKQ